METFLNDYGLTWIGNDGSTQPQEHQGGGLGAEDFAPDFGKLLARITELNLSAGTQ